MEQERFPALVAPYLAVSEFGISAYERGLIKPGTFESAKRDIKRQFVLPGVREWWRGRRECLSTISRNLSITSLVIRLLPDKLPQLPGYRLLQLTMVESGIETRCFERSGRPAGS